MSHRSLPTVEAAAPRPVASQAPERNSLAAVAAASKQAPPAAPQPAPLAKPEPPANAPAQPPAAAAEVEPASRPVARVETARSPTALPIPGSNAPSCKELLGTELTKRRDPKAAQRETQLGNRQLLLGNVALAQAAYCRAFAWDRTNFDRHLNLARLFLVRRDWKKAAEYGQSALKLEPKNPKALGTVGDAWAALHQSQEAREAWLAAEGKLSASPRQLNLMVRRNMALAKRVARLQDFSLAERLYRRVLLVDPAHADAMKGVASCLLKAGEYEAAATWARQAALAAG
jgi:tetratricopeptide (TPR) repeat protein